MLYKISTGYFAVFRLFQICVFVNGDGNTGLAIFVHNPFLEYTETINLSNANIDTQKKKTEEAFRKWLK